MKNLNGDISRRKALAALGITAVVAYSAPVLMKLNTAAASGGGSGGGSGAGSGGGASGGNVLDTNPLIQKECGECHDPYSSRMLPSGSWRNLMNDLPNHFGEDASLDAATQKQIANYLSANAGGSGTGPLRISKTRWFISEHKGEVSKSALQKAKSWSNCTACHRN